MAIFMPVLPAALYPHLDTPEAFGNRFVHAPQVVQCKALADWLIDKQHQSIFVDCFAYELDGGMPDVRMLHEALKMLRNVRTPVVAICPDVLHDHEATMELFKEHHSALAAYTRMLMVVPHADDPTQWFVNAHELLSLARTRFLAQDLMVGLPRYLCNWDNDTRRSFRLVAAEWLKQYWRDIDVHLLGAGKGLWEIVRVVRGAPNVLSADSTTPYVWALNHGLYTDPWGKEEMPAEWWDTSLLDDVPLKDPTAYGINQHTAALVKVNIAIWKEAVERGRPGTSGIE